MAGPTTAERGARRPSRRPKGASGPPSGGPGARPTRLPGLRVLLIGLAAAVLAAGVIWLLYGSDWLRVERVRVTGAEALTPRQVRAAAEVPMGAPVVSVDTDRIEARLRQRLPRIDSVEVSRSWPRGVTLEVTERRAVLILRKGSRFVEVDRDGVRFATVDEAPKDVSRLELTVDGAASLRRFPADRLVEEAVRVRGQLPAKVAADTRTVAVRSYDYIALELTGDRTVIWGSPEDGEAKARALTALMKGTPKARRFDVSAPTAPAASMS
ncbi:cell division protein FtsQ/DivIB [Streptomyces katsurahamanus]|uniref:Cell division protein FtsQ n=1 Tax=Streptomyces katsurahamanus TaxID=2577098 RepID=A0ABW9P1U9_9ACTN|nr:FtsQ-type POTRA domain-containing protein [Streptomyces katsurahamanus]MQS39576.1 FtsQ-type POTRA domain-containing protein [Streptomyces katsurahamanus]